MNCVAYNLRRIRLASKNRLKYFALILDENPKIVRQWESGRKIPSEEETLKIVSKLSLDYEDFTTKINETINLKERKVYGTDYPFLKYSVIDYKSHYENFVSGIIDLLFVILLIIFWIAGGLPISANTEGFLDVLQMIFVIEILVLPFMFIVLPLLKFYFNRTYIAILESNLKEELQDEACAIIYGCLQKSINKSIAPHAFTIFSEIIVGLFCLLYMIQSKEISWMLISLATLAFIAIIYSLYCLRYCFGKKQNKVLKKGN